MPRCRRRLRTARPEGGEVRQSPETFGNGRRRLLRRGAAAGSPCPAAARREVSAAPCPLGKGAMLADSLVEEFEIREDEPWYDQQDLQQGERRGARREGGRGSAGRREWEPEPRRGGPGGRAGGAEAAGGTRGGGGARGARGWEVGTAGTGAARPSLSDGAAAAAVAGPLPAAGRLQGLLPAGYGRVGTVGPRGREKRYRWSRGRTAM